MTKRFRILVAALAGSALCVPALSQSAAPSPTASANGGWMRGEGLRADPELRIGTLPNGMRFVIRKGRTPPGEASLRLRIDTGSLNEAEDQQGLAHFLEHMVLNGSENVPEGEFVKRLERHGLRFGPDTNASTDFGQTIFKLDLPETDRETVDEALFLLREVAGRATIKADAVERERGIILSEERARATPAFRQARDELGWLFPGQLYAQRLPIGTVEVIRNAPRQRLVDFYRAWYRPERATLIVVGDIDPAAIEAKIRGLFGDWRGQGPAGVPADQGRPKPRTLDARVFTDPAIAAGVRIAWVRPPDLEPDSIAKRQREFDEQLVTSILNRRLEKLAQSDSAPPFNNAALSVGEFEHSAEITSLGASARMGDWRRALAAIDAEQRRLMTFGVTPDELQRELTNARAALQAGVAAAPTRTSASLAETLVAAVDRGTVVTSPADRLPMFEAAIKGLGPDRINAAARRLFTGSGPLLYLTLPRPLPGARELLLSAYTTSQKVAVSAPIARQRVTWPYASFGTPGAVVERREIPEIGTTALRFANGVRLTVRPSANRKEQIAIQVRFGDGRLAMDSTRLSPEWALSGALTFGGTNKLDFDSLGRALDGKLVGSSLLTADDRFVLNGITRPEDFATQMQLLAAYMVDAAWRPTGWNRLRANANSIHDRIESSPSGVLGRDIGTLLRSGDKRWSLPGRAAMRASNVAEARSLLDPALRNGPIEIVVVGDISVDKAVAETAATFGTLPPRPQNRAKPGPMVFPRPPAEPLTLFHKGREDQAVAFIAWPTTGYSAATRQLGRTLTLLGAVFQLRLTERLRETEGVSYSPVAGHGASATWVDYGYLSAQVEAPPARLDRFFIEAQEIAADLAERPISEDEFNRARRPTLEAIQRGREGNAFWLAALADIDDPFTLESIRTQESDYRSVTPAMLQAAARRFLVPQTAYKVRVIKDPSAPALPVIVVPAPAAPPPPPRR